MDLGLSGRRALVVGSSSGIGAAIATHLGREGVEVVIHGRSASSADEVCSRIVAEGGRASVVLAALDDPAEVERLAAEALAGGPIDILINSSGASTTTDGWFAAPDGAWQRRFQASAFYVVQLIRAIVPQMRERGWGRVLNVSSGSAIRAMPVHPEYSAAKLALHSIAMTLAAELGDCGVTINTLVSGGILTANTEAVLAHTAAAHGIAETGPAMHRRVLREVWQAEIPLGRLGTVDEVAAVACFLVSEVASYVTGAALRVDGGAAGTVT